jgi:hypothetical protein
MNKPNFIWLGISGQVMPVFLCVLYLAKRMQHTVPSEAMNVYWINEYLLLKHTNNSTPDGMFTALTYSTHTQDSRSKNIPVPYCTTHSHTHTHRHIGSSTVLGRGGFSGLY